MSWIKNSGPFVILSILGFWLIVFSIYDIVFEKGWMLVILASYAILILLILLIIYLRSQKEEVTLDVVEEFEKTLKGKLYHFKCPTCSGIFAIKKSKSNDEKPVKMTCPDCGAIGFVPRNPACIEEEIPEKKSMKANFKCGNCGEGVTVWAEGTDLYKKMHVFSCPFCGKNESMKRI
jgi:predicted RNA-binding Zn-ribbon protein involved in translation (DUF1610 family)